MSQVTIDQALDIAVQHHQAGRWAEAEEIYRQIIQRQPANAGALHLLGVLAGQRGRLDEAIELIRRAIAISPNEAFFYSNLGKFLSDAGRMDDAIIAHRAALRLQPNYAKAHNNLAAALHAKGHLDEAIASYRAALRIDPGYGVVYNNLANVFKEMGELDEAIACYRRSLQLKPDFAAAHGHLVYLLHFHAGYDGRAIREELGRWNRQHAEPLKKLIQPLANDRTPDRRLRIGYVSPDFRDHVVGRNLIPLFREHDRRVVEIFCYSNVVAPDGFTEQFQKLASGCRSLVGVPDEQAAELIRGDKIDILVDLSLHMAGNRLLVFARKPAPVQVTFAGYPGSTGLETIDYRLTDGYLDPPVDGGGGDEHYSEASIRLPESFWCYDPLSEEPAVNALPAQQRGAITFGCFNNFCKVNEGVLRLWAAVLQAVPGSRLIMLAAEGSHRQRTLRTLEQAGVAADRVVFVTMRPRAEYLLMYHEIDIALETVPYNGHTTSLDAMWMGVPVVTLVGKTVVGRAGLCQLMNLGLPELIAYTPEEYVRIVRTLAGDLPRLAGLRKSLRQRMRASLLMDAPRFARNIEAAYRAMWKKWCAEPRETDVSRDMPVK